MKRNCKFRSKLSRSPKRSAHEGRSTYQFIVILWPTSRAANFLVDTVHRKKHSACFLFLQRSENCLFWISQHATFCFSPNTKTKNKVIYQRNRKQITRNVFEIGMHISENVLLGLLIGLKRKFTNNKQTDLPKKLKKNVFQFLFSNFSFKKKRRHLLST